MCKSIYIGIWLYNSIVHVSMQARTFENAQCIYIVIYAITVKSIKQTKVPGIVCVRTSPINVIIIKNIILNKIFIPSILKS